LQAEKIAADAVLRDLTPLESIQDAIALKEYFESLNSKGEVSWSVLSAFWILTIHAGFSGRDQTTQRKA
jgi:hypothetical protein